jgi:hypothetical protein
MLTGARFSSLLAWWLLILLIRQTLNTVFHPPERSIAHIAGGTGDLSNNQIVAAPSCWKCNEDVFTTSFVSLLYSMATIGMSWIQDIFGVVYRCALPYNISKWLWTLAILCNVLPCTSHIMSKSLSVFIVSHVSSPPANMMLLGWKNCGRMTILYRVLHVVCDYPQPITSCKLEKLPSTLLSGGMNENLLHATLRHQHSFSVFSVADVTS